MIEEVIQEKEQIPGLNQAKRPVNSRYFIELHVTTAPDAPRLLVDEIRRHSAIEFVRVIGEWLKDNSMEKEVSDLTVTALGQVMVVCSRSVIDLIREQDIWAIAHIRSSDQFDGHSLIKRASDRAK